MSKRSRRETVARQLLRETNHTDPDEGSVRLFLKEHRPTVAARNKGPKRFSKRRGLVVQQS